MGAASGLGVDAFARSESNPRLCRRLSDTPVKAGRTTELIATVATLPNWCPAGHSCRVRLTFKFPTNSCWSARAGAP